MLFKGAIQHALVTKGLWQPTNYPLYEIPTKLGNDKTQTKKFHQGKIKISKNKNKH